MPSDSIAPPSHPASPFLHAVLTQWTERRQQCDRDQENLNDRMTLALRELDDRRNEIWDHRRQWWQASEQNDPASDGRWTERLRKIQEWQDVLSRLRTRHGEIGGTLSSIRWFDRAQELGKRLATHLDARIGRLENAHIELHEQFEPWLSALATKETELNDLKKKAENHSAPFLVSRARKQPELDYLADNLSKEADLGSQLQTLRRAAALSLGRLYRASRQLEIRARENEGLFETRRKQIVEDLKDTQSRYFDLREKILGDALLYESCRRKLRGVKETVNDLRCIEDVYKAPESVWKKLLAATRL